jgi:hypothetical protein
MSSSSCEPNLAFSSPGHAEFTAAKSPIPVGLGEATTLNPLLNTAVRIGLGFSFLARSASFMSEMRSDWTQAGIKNTRFRSPASGAILSLPNRRMDHERRGA